MSAEPVVVDEPPISLLIPRDSCTTLMLHLIVEFREEDGNRDDTETQIDFSTRNLLLRMAPYGRDIMRQLLREIVCGSEYDASPVHYDEFPHLEIVAAYVQLWQDEKKPGVFSDLVDVWNFVEEGTTIDWDGFDPESVDYYSFADEPGDPDDPDEGERWMVPHDDLQDDWLYRGGNYPGGTVEPPITYPKHSVPMVSETGPAPPETVTRQVHIEFD